MSFSGVRDRPRVIVLAAAVAVGMAVPAAVLTGAAAAPMIDLGDPGPVVRWGLPLVRIVLDVAAATTVGLLLVVTLVGVGERRSAVPRVAARYACLSGTIWALAAGVVTVLGFADVAGVRPFSSGFAGQLPAEVWRFEPLRVEAISAVGAALVAIGAAVTRSRRGLRLLGFFAVVAVLPLAWGGHSAESTNHAVAVGSLAFHLAGVVLWVGGLLALVALRPVIGPAMGTAVQRFSSVAGCCFAVVAISGGLNAWVRIGHLSGLTSPYGLLVLGKSAALVLLGVAGWRQRRAVIPRLRARPEALRPFTRLATAETIVMGAAIGMAAVLARSAPPAPTHHAEPPSTTLLLTVALGAVIGAVAVAVRAGMPRRLHQRHAKPPADGRDHSTPARVHAGSPPPAL
ncbi:copper resistance D family protein [Flexivirga endophytica]|nr:CopD family protein [Flexivirga endophytica]